MEKEIFLLPKKFTLLIFLILSFTFHSSFSQCINPTPSGDASQVFCKSDIPTITNLVAIGGTIVWYDSPSGGVLYGPADDLVNGTTYYADDISGGSCSTSRLPVIVTIYGDIPTNVDVFVGKCAIDNPTVGDLNATGQNIAWYDAQTDGNLLPLSQLLVDGQTYWVQQTENDCTSNRFPTTVSLIDPITPTTAPIQSFCYPPNPTIANLKASGTTILWYESETSTTPLKSTTLLINGEDYWAAAVTFPCVSSNRAQTTVVLDAAPYAGVSSSLTECQVSFVTTNLFDLLGGTPDTTGIWTGPSILANGYLGTFEPGINIEGIYTYTVSSILGICPDDSATISVVITIVQPPTITETTQSFCNSQNALVADLTPNNSNIIWYNADGNVLASDTPLENGIYSAAQTEVFGSLTCESINRADVTVTIVNPVMPTGNQNQSFCLANNPTIGDLQAQTSNPDYTLSWYIDDVTDIALLPNTPLVNGTTYYASEVNNPECESIARLMVTVTISDVAPATIVNISQTFCESNYPTIENLAATGNGIVWYATQTSATPLLVTSPLMNGVAYWAAQSNATTGCVSSVRVVANITLTTIETPSIISLGNEFCKINNPTISDLNLNVAANNGGAISWYDSFPNGNLLNASTALIEGETYYAIETDVIGCKSINPLEVTVTLEVCDDYDIEIYDGFSPTGNGTNDTFKIKNLRELYPDFKVEFFNRWGNLIYTASAAKPDWNGRLNGDGELSPTGVYFFVIYFNKNDKEPIQRRLYLSR
jgi:gliding motility-associated-like protein